MKAKRKHFLCALRMGTLFLTLCHPVGTGPRRRLIGGPGPPLNVVQKAHPRPRGLETGRRCPGQRLWVSHRARWPMLAHAICRPSDAATCWHRCRMALLNRAIFCTSSRSNFSLPTVIADRPDERSVMVFYSHSALWGTDIRLVPQSCDLPLESVGCSRDCCQGWLQASYPPRQRGGGHDSAQWPPLL